MSKKAVIQSGGKQYLVQEGEEFLVEKLSLGDEEKSNKIIFNPMLVIDGENTEIGTPTLTKHKVAVEIIEDDLKEQKVTSIRYKAKKRVHTVKGHRQHKTKLKIVSIS